MTSSDTQSTPQTAAPTVPAPRGAGEPTQSTQRHADHYWDCFEERWVRCPDRGASRSGQPG